MGAVVERINSELANTLGNLVNRTISMSNKYFGGVVTNAGAHEPVDDDLKAVVTEPEKCKCMHGQSSVWQMRSQRSSILFKRCNKYIDETMPWALAKDETNADRLATPFFTTWLRASCIGACLLEPFMPETTEKIVKQLNAEKRLDRTWKFGLYPSGNKVTDKPEILFARLDAPKIGQGK